MSGGQECYLHTHSHSELALRETEEEEDEETEWDGKVIWGLEVNYEEKTENVDKERRGR